MKEQWKQVGTFGEGKILAKGVKRKLVTEGMKDFEYIVKQEKIKKIKLK